MKKFWAAKRWILLRHLLFNNPRLFKKYIKKYGYKIPIIYAPFIPLYITTEVSCAKNQKTD